MFRQIPPLPTSICSVRYLLCQLQHVPSDTSSANFNMFCQIPPLPTSICYLRQIPPLPTSICSVRYLLCQLQYVLCDFLRSKVFLKSFVPQCNNNIRRKINQTTFDMVDYSLCCCSRNPFYRCNVFWVLYVFNNGGSCN